MARVRRRSRLAGLFVLALVSTGACTPPADPDTLRVLVEKAPTNLDPRYGSDQASSRAHALVYRSLFSIGDDLAPHPDLVTAVATPDPCRYVLTLERGVRFSDGRQLTARDVVYTIDSIRSGASFRHSDLDGVVAVSAPDPETVVLELREPAAAFVAGLTFGIVPEGLDDASADPIGAGPYRLVSRAGPHVIELERWEATPPGAFRRVRFQAVADEMARGLAIRKGDVDLVVNDLAPEAFRSLARDRRYQAIVGDGSNYAYLMMNCAVAPLDDVRVRQAIAFAIDRQEMIDTLVMGLGRPATGLLSPESWAYRRPPEPWASHAADDDRAGALLDAAGFPDPDGPGGRPRFALTYKSSSLLSSRAQAAVVQDYLRRVGIELRVQSYEWSTFFEDVKHGNFELASLVWVGISDPDALRARFHSAMFPPAGVNRGRYGNGRLDRLLEAGVTATDRAERRQAYAQAQEILAREVPYVSLWYKSNYALVRIGISGVHLGPFGDFSFVPDLRRDPDHEAAASASSSATLPR